MHKNKLEIEGISKQYFMGWPYVKAFLDNEYVECKIQAGQCRLLKENLGLPASFSTRSNLPMSLLEENHSYYYFHWMLPRIDCLEAFKREYEEACQRKGQKRYTQIAEVLQRYCILATNTWTHR